MSDPKNIPLSEARAGDMVFLKPLKLMETWEPSPFQPVSYAKGFVDSGHAMTVRSEFIDHIERAPRPLEVGDVVKLPGWARPFCILHINDGIAWLKDKPSDHNSVGHDLLRPLTDLERVDG